MLFKFCIFYSCVLGKASLVIDKLHKTFYENEIVVIFNFDRLELEDRWPDEVGVG